MSKMRSFLKWAGSKYNCLHQVTSSLPTGQRLIEPFAGSGVVFLNTEYSSYLLAEENKDLIKIYTLLKQQGESFINYCEEFFKPETNCKTHYYTMRSLFNNSSLTPEKSALFLYLNRHGYNGLCRYNSKGIFNVPFGSYIKPYFPRKEMDFFYKKSIKAEFLHNDFRKTFALAEQGDVIYCDPPYVPISKYTRPFAYTQKTFNEQDQIELAELARETAAKGIPVIISNHDTAFTRTHYHGAKINSFPVSRWISCQANLRQPAKEMIAVFSK